DAMSLEDTRRPLVEQTAAAGSSPVGPVAEPSAPPLVEPTKLAIKTRQGTKFLDLSAVVVVSAQGHYSNVGFKNACGKFEQQFC
ncbi:hypothetical protein ACKI16_47720, partial [Streptomyces scabiei]|uniref:hypothetical protein n=1 Tax=Streptomyces scabiei TaxID=1930 RepID=UPI0038F72B1A